MRLWFRPKRIPLTVPGPSPWYLRAPWAPIKTPHGQYTWETLDGPILSGVSCLLTPEKKPVLLLDFYCYTLPFSDNRALVWHETGREQDSAVSPPRITFTILSLAQLRPFPDVKAAAEALKDKKQRMAFEGGDRIVFEAPTNLGEGVHPIAPPQAFRNLPETLVLADFGSELGNSFDKMSKAIFAFDFNAGHVTVFPQRWFNEGSYDFGYQWITRVQREQKTGQIVGEGIRLGNFRLDPSATQIEEWLHKDVFYHPEHEL